jgi:hypothetical protein
MSNAKREQLIRMRQIIAALSDRDPKALEDWLCKGEQLAHLERDRKRS